MPVRVWNEKDVASFNFSVLPGNVGKAREGNEVHEVLAGNGQGFDASTQPCKLPTCRTGDVPRTLPASWSAGC